MKIEPKEIFAGQTDLYKKRLQKNTFDLKYRNQLLKSAYGKVLEVAVGAGVNFRFYDPAVEVTAVDFAPSLLDVASLEAAKYGIYTNFINMDVETIEFDDNSFDTIVSTWSLCTYTNPVQVLHNFNRWCKPNGQILFFEHGLNGNKLLDSILHFVDGMSVRKIGCHANVDVIKAISDSGILTERLQKVLLIYFLIWAKPDKTLVG